MSFTLMRYKDGVPTPIRMSIWDAFKGAPDPKPPKPRPVSLIAPVVNIQEPEFVVVSNPRAEPKDAPIECPCCRKFHTVGQNAVAPKEKGKDPTQKPDSKKKDKNDDSNNSKDDDKGTHNFSKHDQETYSEKDDKTIIEMKEDKKNWAEILEAIGKQSKSQLQAHWKTIDPSNPDNAKTNYKGEKDKTTDAKKDEGDKKKDKNDQAKKKEPEKNENKSKVDEKKTVSSKAKNDKLSDGERQLRSWSDRYDKQKWIAAASRHFDLTGQRITPEMAKKLIGGS